MRSSLLGNVYVYHRLNTEILNNQKIPKKKECSLRIFQLVLKHIIFIVSLKFSSDVL